MNKNNLIIVFFVILMFILGFYLREYVLFSKKEEKNDEKVNIYKDIEEEKNDEKLKNFTWNIESSDISSWIFELDKPLELENENISENIQKEEKKYDMKTDSSIEKFVNAKISFNDVSYVPQNLVKIDSQYVDDTKGNQVLREVSNQALQNMAKDFFEETWEKMKVVSAYRSYDYQVWIKKRGCPDNLCAKAWFSEHQTWLVVDLWSASSKETWDNDEKLKKYSSWLNKNAHKYWFHNTYQKWLEIDSYDIEPWHWRYLWENFATYLKNNDLTIAEYYYKNI